MTKLKVLATVCFCIFMSSSLFAQIPQSAPTQGSAPAGAGTVPFQNQYKDGPAFKDQNLVLTDLPKPIGKAEKLFNGRDFKGWELWVAIPGLDPRGNFTQGQGAPQGQGMPQGQGVPQGQAAPQTQAASQVKATVKPEEMFKIVQEDGAPAIWISGDPLGALISDQDFSNYHLRVSYKFIGKGSKSGEHNSGLLYHSTGAKGAFWGAWMQSYEFEINVGQTGMSVVVSGADTLGLKVEIGQDPSKGPRYMAGGSPTTVKGMGMIQALKNVEKPVGEWNTLDLYCVGEQCIHVVNGVPVMELKNLQITDKNGVTKPLTHGQVQFQSEAGEVLYRDITVEKIDKMPKVEVK